MYVVIKSARFISLSETRSYSASFSSPLYMIILPTFPPFSIGNLRSSYISIFFFILSLLPFFTVIPRSSSATAENFTSSPFDTDTSFIFSPFQQTALSDNWQIHNPEASPSRQTLFCSFHTQVPLL